MTPYTLILVVVLAISPWVLKLAEKQDKKTKSRLKNIFLLLLIGQTLLGLPSWKLLPLFLTISTFQIFLVVRKIPLPAVLLSFVNTVIFFFTLIRLDRGPIENSANLTYIAIAFIVLIGNVVGLLLANKEKKLQPQPLSRRGKLIFTLVLVLATTAILGLSFWNKNTQNAAITKVSSLPEVRDYLRDVPNGVVTIDHEDKETNSYLIHVYEIKDGHTATFNWYEVNKTTGKVTTNF